MNGICSDPGYRPCKLALVCIALVLAGCCGAEKKRQAAAAAPVSIPVQVPVQVEEMASEEGVPEARGGDIEDLKRVPQRIAELPRPEEGVPALDAACGAQLLGEFKQRYFSRWSSSPPFCDPAELISYMKKVANSDWYGTNKRRVPRHKLQELLRNCSLANFPSRKDQAIAVEPGHLRALPTQLPFYKVDEGAPFDMLSHPQVKLNEPLRVLHASADGVWLFVETGYSCGWIEARDVALVDQDFVVSWMQAPPLVIVRDYLPIPDGRGTGTYPAKIGTILPLAGGSADSWWEVFVASAGEGGKAEKRQIRIPREAAVPLPLPFSRENVALVGDQLLGQPYGWGEGYDLRDCSALLRDFFLPFGIWMPRTSSEQIGSIRQRHQVAALAPPAKSELIAHDSVPFLTLLYKPGHIMLYAGEDKEGRPLAFHSAWSVRVKEGAKERTWVIGTSAITTLEPGKELGLVPGSSLLEKVTEFATVTGRCQGNSGKKPER